MVVIKSVDAKSIFDSRKEKTVFVSVKTDVGVFSASAPNGKSKGKNEAKSYAKSLDEDIRMLKKFSDYFSKDNINNFDDLRRIEDVVDRQIGANTIYALEAAILKAVAKEQKKEVWQLINPKANPKIRLVGNCIGGGKHSKIGRKPDFQEFLIIPNMKSVKENWEKSKKLKEEAKYLIKERDNKFDGKKNDEDAWNTNLGEKEVFDILKKMSIPFGTDVAASGFFKRKSYHYENPMLKRNKDEQFDYISNLIRNFSLFYIEDPFDEEDFESFSKLLKKYPDSLIVGDDLTTTNYKRLEKAIKMRSINAIIVKPNQCGSLLEMKRVCGLAKKHDIKIVFSHRSGETKETILADLAFGFGADFFKCGITGKEREVKIKRLIAIERKLR
ncbi:MAG: enolase C-terminal domain-like protein [Candidatus Pacearchaeota archaeon]